MGRGARATALCLVAGSLAGCAGGAETLVSSTTSSVSSTFGNLLAFNTSKPGDVAPRGPGKEPPLQCPTIEVLDGTASLRGYAGAEQVNSNVKYQYSLGDVARECTKSGKEVLIKVGVEGRVLLGPDGQPGTFSVPIRIAVRRDSDHKPIAGKLYQVPVTIAFGQTQGEFTMVSEPISVPYVQAHADEDYTILVGFDEHGNAPAAKPGRGKPKPGTDG